jgi:transposase
MTKKRKKYTDDFKRETVRVLNETDKSARQLERELGIGKSCVSRWKRELESKGENAFPGQGNLTPEKERIRELEREVEILRQERDILKKAVAIFSRPSPRDSSSSKTIGRNSR